MIHIFFNCGSFGSTIEYAIRNFSDFKGGPVAASILGDGSMHSFTKQYHITSYDHLENFSNGQIDPDGISTPTYPFKEFKLPQLLARFSLIPTWNDDTKILVYQPDTRAAELNLLFKYHKVCYGEKIQTGLGIITGDNRHNLSGWNIQYTHWSQMRDWELREWLSLFYPGWITEFIDSQDQVDTTWLKISNTDVLFDTKQTLCLIMSFCGLTMIHSIDEFVDQWRAAQEYIVKEFLLLDQIISCTLNGRHLEWHDLNIIAEAILQQRFRQLGFEILCDGLDQFPLNTKELYKLLVKVQN